MHFLTHPNLLHFDLLLFYDIFFKNRRPAVLFKLSRFLSIHSLNYWFSSVLKSNLMLSCFVIFDSLSRCFGRFLHSRNSEDKALTFGFQNSFDCGEITLVFIVLSMLSLGFHFEHALDCLPALKWVFLTLAILYYSCFLYMVYSARPTFHAILPNFDLTGTI